MGRPLLSSNVKNIAVELELEYRLRELREEAQEKYSNSLAAFVKDAWHILEPGAPYVHGWHIDAMCEHLQAVSDGVIQNLLINVPPGMLKSLLVSVFFPCWEWGAKKKPHMRYLCASHKQDLSMRDNIRARRLILSDWYQDRFPDVVLTSDQNAKLKFETTKLGFREALAAGSITGSRGDRVLIDDALSVSDANSEAILDSKKQWFLEAVPTRVNDIMKSSIIVIMQRLHDQDTSGVILDNKLKYVHLCLPMEYEKARHCRTIIGFSDPRKKEGELLFPKRFPRVRVNELKKSLGSYASAGQLQQDPVPRGGAIIKLEWLKFIDAQDIPANFSYLLESCDTAFKTGASNDYSACMTMGLYENKKYILDLHMGKHEFPELINIIRSRFYKVKPHALLIEDKASGQSLVQVLKNEFGAFCKPIKVDSDKVSRCHAISPMVENGDVLIVKAPWNEEFIKHLIRFPKAAVDDDVDAFTMGLNHLAKFRERKMIARNFDYFSR